MTQLQICSFISAMSKYKLVKAKIITLNVSVPEISIFTESLNDITVNTLFFQRPIDTLGKTKIISQRFWFQRFQYILSHCGNGFKYPRLFLRDRRCTCSRINCNSPRFCFRYFNVSESIRNMTSNSFSYSWKPKDALVNAIVITQCFCTWDCNFPWRHKSHPRKIVQFLLETIDTYVKT